MERHRIHADTSLAIIGDRIFTGLCEVTADLGVLDGTGTWVVLLPFEGPPLCARFSRVDPLAADDHRAPTPWPGLTVVPADWASTLDRDAFEEGVRDIRSRIAAGTVYQVNLTRRHTTPLPPGADIVALGRRLAEGNPAPFAAVVRLVDHDVHVASASPERFLERDGSRIWSSPIKGTAPTADVLTAKDVAENVMIVDLVRNDLGRVCTWGSVEVPELCAIEEHPGLVHLVSTVSGTLRPGTTWRDILAATFPPGSVTGAPKLAALDVIDDLEPSPRGPYCGAIGWVDADRSTAVLNVAIRTFWFSDGNLCLGTGGGITWDSDPGAEWRETELKARNLLMVATSPGGMIDR